MSKSERQPLRIGIIGAGLSGLSLALALQSRKDFDGEVHLFEPREQYIHDRHWSFWDASGHFFRSIKKISFDNIGVLKGNTEKLFDCNTMPYCVLSSEDVYEYAKTVLANDLRFYLHMGSSVIDVASVAGHLELSLTEDGCKQFDLVFDSRIVDAANTKGLLQWFKGAEVRIEKSAGLIKPRLMDFCLENGRPIGFFYVLPLDDSRVLVQLTYFLAPNELPPEDASEIWTHYVSNTLGLNPNSIIREENGCIPMQVMQTDHKAFGHHAIGTAAGWVRAATGYGFLDIQRAARRVAEACCISDTFEREKSLRQVKARSHWDDRLDEVFLATLKREPERAPEFFFNIFNRASSDAVIRFLSGTATWRDRIAVMRSLPVAPFTKSLLSSIGQ
jgi:lycopene beta-cyclase